MALNLRQVYHSLLNGGEGERVRCKPGNGGWLRLTAEEEPTVTGPVVGQEPGQRRVRPTGTGKTGERRASADGDHQNQNQGAAPLPANRRANATIRAPTLHLLSAEVILGHCFNTSVPAYQAQAKVGTQPFFGVCQYSRVPLIGG